ncbi:MAG: hypothetical protein H6541_02895 [Lentimicrobiaceae bacterium]|nr:hypothetical protein [Lentimicrobiaceae bacterium]
MGYIEKSEKLDFLLEIIKKGNCGNAACMADPECALLCMILGPECAASVAIGCYISVNNGTAGH